MFYKKDDKQLHTATIVAMPELTLTEDNHSEHNYPVDNWYWFDDLDKAIVFYATQKPVESITPRQIRLQLSAIGMRKAVEDYVASASLEIKDWWEYSTYLERNSPLLVGVATSLGMTREQLDQFFVEAGKL